MPAASPARPGSLEGGVDGVQHKPDCNPYPNDRQLRLPDRHHDQSWNGWARGIAGYWFPKADLHSESFAFDLLHNANAIDQAFPRKIDADAWFDNWAAPKYQITEQSLRIPGEGVITILNLD
ncbi:hypothetical protein [Rhizobium laguerreae]|uniref:hypothetical protein n=1 Tax=Rhizobium laguerreae TaxID=1076926 RepID=UPI0035E425E2